MAEKEGLIRSARGFALSLRLLHLRCAPSNSVLTPHLAAPNSLLGFAQWRRRRDWCCCAKSLRDRLWRPIFAALRRTSFSSLIWLRQIVCWASPNGGEGGIRTPGAISSTTDFESVTFGHSATSPKMEIEKRFKSAWQAWTEICHMFCFARDLSGRRGAAANFSSRRFLVDNGGFIHTVRC